MSSATGSELDRRPLTFSGVLLLLSFYPLALAGAMLLAAAMWGILLWLPILVLSIPAFIVGHDNEPWTFYAWFYGIVLGLFTFFTGLIWVGRSRRYGRATFTFFGMIVAGYLIVRPMIEAGQPWYIISGTMLAIILGWSFIMRRAMPYISPSVS